MSQLRISVGARPTDLPKQSYELKLALDLRAANAIGSKISKEILRRANEVME